MQMCSRGLGSPFGLRSSRRPGVKEFQKVPGPSECRVLGSAGYLGVQRPRASKNSRRSRNQGAQSGPGSPKDHGTGLKEVQGGTQGFKKFRVQRTAGLQDTDLYIYLHRTSLVSHFLGHIYIVFGLYL